MQKIIDFLSELQVNNNREWFNAHKSQYLEAKALFDEFTEKLIAGIREFDEQIGALTVKDCTYRIYRDVRFSEDKSPYKIHFGAFICPKGRKSGYSGYYFQIGANDKGYPGGCMLATGNYFCEPKALKILREDISLDDDNLFANALKEACERTPAETARGAKGFVLDYEGALKRVPNGFPADQPYSDWLRLKNFCLVKEPGIDYMIQPNLLERTLADFRTTMPFLHFVNRAIEYAKNEC